MIPNQQLTQIILNALPPGSKIKEWERNGNEVTMTVQFPFTQPIIEVQVKQERTRE